MTPLLTNPFYARRLNRQERVAPPIEARDRPVYAKLPSAPINASPVVIANCAGALVPGGKIVILMGFCHLPGYFPAQHWNGA